MNLEEEVLKNKNDIKNMHDRMDSFVNQITQTKESLTSLCRDNIKKLEEHVNRNSKFLSKYEDVQDVIEKLSRKIKDDFEESVKKNSNDAKAITLDIMKRFNSLEDYIKNDRFHSLLLDLNDLEDRFHKEALKLVNKTVTSTKKGKKTK